MEKNTRSTSRILANPPTFLGVNRGKAFAGVEILPPHSYRNKGLYPPTRIEKPPHSYRKLQGRKNVTINYITTPRPFERRAGLLLVK